MAKAAQRILADATRFALGVRNGLQGARAGGRGGAPSGRRPIRLREDA